MSLLQSHGDRGGRGLYDHYASELILLYAVTLMHRELLAFSPRW